MMLELPEVEIIRRELERDLVGRKIKTAEAASMKVLGRYRMRKAFTTLIEGRKIESVKRRGLFLTVVLSGDRTMVIELGSGAVLRRHANKDPVVRYTELVITFTQQGQLRLVDPDGSSDVFAVDTDALKDELPQLEGYGFDPISNQVPWRTFGQRLLSKPVKLKTLLMDPTFIIGIGNIYADEILFDAGLRYDRMSDSLSVQEIRRLHRALVSTIHSALRHRGTSLRERPFVDPSGVEGDYARHLEVWGRHGRLSSRSRKPIKRVKFRGAWTYYCETQN